ncbi:hypothetical protein CDAR_101941 [Caerostris darwini]|uniref:Uncharacterized protein n=1 Tax=Caerostris darwini TaxID=1538125 RepID=A0AAV4TC55_9ARAC|nr:hypothetical protein CDAR_101941 [Caerostris darwini]
MNTWELSGGIGGQGTFHESRTKNRSQKNRTSGTRASYFLMETEILLNMCKEYKILVPNRHLLVLGPSSMTFTLCNRTTEAYWRTATLVSKCIGATSGRTGICQRLPIVFLP